MYNTQWALLRSLSYASIGVCVTHVLHAYVCRFFTRTVEGTHSPPQSPQCGIGGSCTCIIYCTRIHERTQRLTGVKNGQPRYFYCFVPCVINFDSNCLRETNIKSMIILQRDIAPNYTRIWMIFYIQWFAAYLFIHAHTYMYKYSIAF